MPSHGINERQEYSGTGHLDDHDFHFQAPLAEPLHPPSFSFEEDHAKNPDGWGGGIIPSLKKRFAPTWGA
jgi:hypothetical protein